MPRTAAVEPVLDYPQDGETVCATHYTIRVGAPAAAQRVEVSVDGGPWQDCRPASGYWWHDWTGYASGTHKAVARLWTLGGRSVTSLPRRFKVELARDGASTAV